MRAPQRPVPRVRAAAALAAAALIATACSSGGNASEAQDGRAAEQSAAPLPVAAANDVLPDPKLQLSPETVVVRSNGGRAVKEIPDDRDTIVIDAGAEGADQLDQGEIMLLTGVTVVRIKALERTGDDLRITAAPVTLPEVIRNGELSWDAMPVDLSAARVSVWDDPTDDGPTTAGRPREGPPAEAEEPHHGRASLPGSGSRAAPPSPAGTTCPPRAFRPMDRSRTCGATSTTSWVEATEATCSVSARTTSV